MTDFPRPGKWKTRRRGEDRIPLDRDFAVVLVVARLLDAVSSVAEYAAESFESRDDLDDDDRRLRYDLRGIVWNLQNASSILEGCTYGNIELDSEYMLGDLSKLDAIFDELFAEECEADAPTVEETALA